MEEHVHDPEPFVTDAGHVHERCVACGEEWHLGTERDIWEPVERCPGGRAGMDQGGPVVRVVQETARSAPPHHPIEEPPALMMRVAGLGGLGPVQAGGPGESPTPDWGGPGGPGTSSNLSRGREVEREYEQPGPGGPPRTIGRPRLRWTWRDRRRRSSAVIMFDRPITADEAGRIRRAWLETYSARRSPWWRRPFL